MEQTREKDRDDHQTIQYIYFTAIFATWLQSSAFFSLSLPFFPLSLSFSLFFFSLVFFSCIFSAIYFNFKLYIWCIEEEQTKMAMIKRCCLHIGPTVIQRKTLIRAYISLTITPTLSTRWRRQRKSAWSKSSTDASFHSCALSPSFKSVSTMQHFTYKLSCFLTA